MSGNWPPGHHPPPGFRPPGKSQNELARTTSFSFVHSIHQKGEQIRQDLYSKIRYDDCGLHCPPKINAGWLCADALTYLEKLTLGTIRTKNARKLPIQEVHQVLKSIIPMHFYITAGVPRNLCMREKFVVDQNYTMLAATKYIEQLVANHALVGPKLPERPKGCKDRSKVKRETEKVGEKGQTWSHEVATHPSADTPGPVSDTEMALKKMDKWAELWLNGTLKKSDWQTFEHCLSIPG